MKIIKPDSLELEYEGRVDKTNPERPVFIFPNSCVHFRARAKKIAIRIENKNVYWNNYLGVLVDGTQTKLHLSNEEGMQEFLIVDNETEAEHEITVFKRMDACHYFTFEGILLHAGGELLAPPVIESRDGFETKRRMEFYGDSVTAGEVSEAIEYVGKEDPEHQGEFSNAYYSYAAMTARKLGAKIHNISQGGIALLDGTGYFCAPILLGMESVYDKVKYNPELGEITAWDFSKYTPQIVVIVFGQNDKQPVDYMKEEFFDEKNSNPQAVHWKECYKKFVRKIRKKYPKALIILTTTILCHELNWDRTIKRVAKEMDDEKVVYFGYSQTGCGTKGHIRIGEAEKMSLELVKFIRSFGESVWDSY